MGHPGVLARSLGPLGLRHSWGCCPVDIGRQHSELARPTRLAAALRLAHIYHLAARRCAVIGFGAMADILLGGMEDRRLQFLDAAHLLDPSLDSPWPGP